MRYDYDRFDFLIRQEITQGSETDVIYRVPDFVGNLFGTPDRKDRKYGAGEDCWRTRIVSITTMMKGTSFSVSSNGCRKRA